MIEGLLTSFKNDISNRYLEYNRHRYKSVELINIDIRQKNNTLLDHFFNTFYVFFIYIYYYINGDKAYV